MTNREMAGMSVVKQVVRPNGDIEFTLKGKLHRDGGPAFISASGTQKYYKHGQLHREDGPAVLYADGGEEWHQHGQLHRIDGPAVISASGVEEFWLHGVPRMLALVALSLQEELGGAWRSDLHSLKRGGIARVTMVNPTAGGTVRLFMVNNKLSMSVNAHDRFYDLADPKSLDRMLARITNCMTDPTV